jgi:hypothetical protein
MTGQDTAKRKVRTALGNDFVTINTAYEQENNWQ